MGLTFTFTSIEAYQRWLTVQPSGCSQVVEHYLSRIAEDRHLNAFLEVYAEEARDRAHALDEKRKAGGPLGLLHGVVVALKDVISYKGHPLTAASKILAGYTALYHSTAVEKLLAEDAIIIGRNNCDEFAMGSTNENSAYGNVLNARCTSRVPGGSSGGSAVAVQAGLCMIALGSDTGGSVRQPADFCGIIGFKPSYGRISRYGLIAYASSFDQIGIFGMTVPDVARVIEVIAGEDEFDSTVKRGMGERVVWGGEGVPGDGSGGEPGAGQEGLRKSYRIAYFKEALDHPGLDPEIRDAILDRAATWRAAGHAVEAIDFPLLDYIVPAYYVLTTAEASSNLARFDGVRYGSRTAENGLELTEFYKRTRSEGFGREVKRRILLGTFVLSAGYYDAYFTKAQRVRRRLVEQTEMIFNDFDVIVLPTSPTTAFPVGEKMSDPIAMYLADIYTVYANLTGIPGISLPLFTHTNGMPFGVQAMTSRYNDVSLLQFSHMIMQQ
jgi:aspartyl-tRNA(Asn)/glutamyl-tRNA(Gln) amidotransferase subunit A